MANKNLFHCDSAAFRAFHDARCAHDNFIITNVNRYGDLYTNGFYVVRYSNCLPNFYCDTSDIKFIRYTSDKIRIGEL